MQRATAITAAVTLTTLLVVSPTSRAATEIAPAAANSAELLLEKHYSESGFEIDLFVTRTPDGAVLSEATLTDPESTEELDVWTDGTTVWWDGQVDGQHVNESAAAIEVIDPDTPQAFCLHPIGAIVCIGALVVVFGGCGAGFGCPPPEASNPPDSSGHGGGGDAGDDGGDGSDGDGDGSDE